jgi:hypothetical protein
MERIGSVGVRCLKVFAGLGVSSCGYVAASCLTAELVMICEASSCRRQILLVLPNQAGVPSFQLCSGSVWEIISYPDYPANRRGC